MSMERFRMGFRLDIRGFDELLARWGAAADLWAPALMPRCGRHADQDVVGYRPVRRFSEFVLDRKSFFSPKEVVFPVRERLFCFTGERTEEAPLPARDAIVFLRACDLNGLDRLDAIFLRNGPVPDPYYAQRRARVNVVLIECTRGFDTCFCVAMNANRAAPDAYAAAARFSGDSVLLEVAAPGLAAALAGLPAAPEDFTPAFVERNGMQVTVPPPDAVTPELFADPLWKDYSKRCIACGRCNTSCPTCSCFNQQDVPPDGAGAPGERRRVWTGCHLDGFTAMAGGHEFRKEYGDRMRFKTMHKINDFHRRFGTHMCVGCGRCEDVCPEYISFARCINLLAQARSPSGPAAPSESP